MVGTEVGVVVDPTVGQQDGRRAVGGGVLGEFVDCIEDETAVGEVDGRELSVLVGAMVGEHDGKAVAPLDGTMLGVLVGAIVGEPVGNRVDGTK